MDSGHTYASPEGVRASLYLAPGFAPPPSLEVLVGDPRHGVTVEFVLVSERSLTCGAVDGVKSSCESWDCHRLELGKCQCGRHKPANGNPKDRRRPARISRAEPGR